MQGWSISFITQFSFPFNFQFPFFPPTQLFKIQFSNTSAWQNCLASPPVRPRVTSSQLRALSILLNPPPRERGSFKALPVPPEACLRQPPAFVLFFPAARPTSRPRLRAATPKRKRKKEVSGVFFLTTNSSLAGVLGAAPRLAMQKRWLLDARQPHNLHLARDKRAEACKTTLRRAFCLSVCPPTLTRPQRGLQRLIFQFARPALFPLVLPPSLHFCLWK